MGPKAKALEKRANLQSEMDQKAAEEEERKAAKDWDVGAKDLSKARAAEEKEAARLKKAAEMAALLKEDAELAASGAVKKIVKPKKKGKDDFDLLDAALKAAPKTKAQKEAEEKKKADEAARKKAELEAAERKAARLKAEEELRQRALKKGVVFDHTDDLFVPINNHLEEDEDGEGGTYEESGTGLDAALGVLDLGGKGGPDEHPERRMKALFNAFSDRMLPQLKEEMPGLKLSQYKERIFDAWKTSPENPKRGLPR